MKLVTFDAGEGPRTGAIIGDGSIVDLAAAAPEAARGMLSTMLALIEGVGSAMIGPAHATTLSFVLLIVFLILRPQGLLGRKGFE